MDEAYRYLKKEAARVPWSPRALDVLTASGLGGLSGTFHSEGSAPLAAVSGAAGGTLGAVPGSLAGYMTGHLLSSSFPRMGSVPLRAGGLVAGGVLGAVYGGAAGGRLSDYVTGLIPGRKEGSSNRIAAWLRDREQRLGGPY